MSAMGGASKEWFTAQELASLELAAIAGSERGVQKQAEREGWQSRPREGKGGGREYHITSLPEAARIDLALRKLAETPEADLSEEHSPPSRAPASPRPGTQGAALPSDKALVSRARATGGRAVSIPTGKAASRAAARLVVLNLLETFREEGGLSYAAARQAFSHHFNAGSIDVEDWVKAEVGTVSIGSLARWQSQVTRDGAKRLGGNYGNRKGKGQIEGDNDLRDFCLGMIAERPHLIASQLVEAIAARYGKDIPKRTVQRFMSSARVKYADALLRAANPDRHKNLRLVAFGSQSEKATCPNRIWEIDASPADIMTKDGRMTLVGMVDVFSRRAKVLVTPTPKATAATLLVRRCIMAWGVPELIKMDNGKDFKSAHVARALGGLGIAQKYCPPFTPEGKPHIERFFQTLQHQFVSLLPGFIGHNVNDRKAIEARRSFAERFGDAEGAIAVELSAEDLQTKLDDWIEHVYHTKLHSEIKATPQLKAASWQGSLRRIDNERALDMLLAEAPDTTGGRTVQKKGIRVENTYFIAGELGGHVGERVHVRLDPADMGRIVVYDEEGRFICIAEAPERTGLDRQEVAARAKQVQKAKVREAQNALNRIKRDHKVHNIADEIVAAHRAEQVLEFPRRMEPHSTPELEAAAKAARALDDPQPDMPAYTREDVISARENEALVIAMPEREETDARLTDPLAWFKWARDHQDELNEIQRETFEALEQDPLIRLRLNPESSERA